MKYNIYKTNSDGTLLWYEVDAYSVTVEDNTVYFYNQVGGLEGAFRDFDSILPKKELK